MRFGTGNIIMVLFGKNRKREGFPALAGGKCLPGGEGKKEVYNLEITLAQYLIVCPLVFLSGVVDSMAGGGGLISLPAYLIAGLPTHYAMATNKLSSSMGTTLATVQYARKGYIPLKPAVCCVVCAFLGSSIGARLALMVEDRYFKMLMLVILPLTALYVSRSRSLIREREEYPLGKTIFIAMAVALPIGMYDGFYGPGTGTFLILLLTGAAHMKITQANGVAKAINLTTNITTVSVYLMSGKTVITLGLVSGAFAILGNYLGCNLFIKGGARNVKPVMVAVLAVFFVKVLWELVV